MALTCREFIESLDAYRSGDLGPNEHARYEDHLLQCLDCLVYLRNYEETRVLLSPRRTRYASAARCRRDGTRWRRCCSVARNVCRYFCAGTSTSMAVRTHSPACVPWLRKW